MVALAQCIDRTRLIQENSNEISQLRERIFKRDPDLATYRVGELVAILERRSQQGRGDSTDELGSQSGTNRIHERVRPTSRPVGDQAGSKAGVTSSPSFWQLHRAASITSTSNRFMCTLYF
jgi:hypothetical protein